MILMYCCRWWGTGIDSNCILSIIPAVFQFCLGISSCWMDELKNCQSLFEEISRQLPEQLAELRHSQSKRGIFIFARVHSGLNFKLYIFGLCTIFNVYVSYGRHFWKIFMVSHSLLQHHLGFFGSATYFIYPNLRHSSFYCPPLNFYQVFLHLPDFTL